MRLVLPAGGAYIGSISTNSMFYYLLTARTGNDVTDILTYAAHSWTREVQC